MAPLCMNIIVILSVFRQRQGESVTLVKPLLDLALVLALVLTMALLTSPIVSGLL